MAKAELPAPELLRQLLDYDPATGHLYWKERQPHHVKHGLQAQGWNRQYAGRRADTLVLRRTNGASWMQILLYDKKYRAHRVIWAIYHGTWPLKQIDHINGDSTDNRILNLREVSDAENKRNLPLSHRNRSGVIGVFFTNEPGRKKPWLARIRANNRNVHIGAYETKEEAVAARKSAEVLYGYHPNHGRKSHKIHVTPQPRP